MPSTKALAGTSLAGHTKRNTTSSQNARNSATVISDNPRFAASERSCNRRRLSRRGSACGSTARGAALGARHEIPTQFDKLALDIAAAGLERFQVVTREAPQRRHPDPGGGGLWTGE